MIDIEVWFEEYHIYGICHGKKTNGEDILQ